MDTLASPNVSFVKRFNCTLNYIPTYVVYVLRGGLTHNVHENPFYCLLFSADERFFLQLNFTNCYLSMMRLSTVDCGGLTRMECSEVLNKPQNKLQDSVFEKFSRDLITLCYHAAVSVCTYA